MDDHIELIGGKEKREIRIVSHDPAWSGRFIRERQRIATALGDVAVRVDHIGSTAVPGLAAKPILDIDLSVPDVEAEKEYLPQLEAAGYVLRVRQRGHRLVRTAERDVHVHICDIGSDWEYRHLLFRDWLRQNAEDREAYGRLKVELAQREWADMNEYADAKGPLIADITERAEVWARDSGWTP
jgi:GrpB-like predicted nucleotidyltransferase (UPF0157 family)